MPTTPHGTATAGSGSMETVTVSQSVIILMATAIWQKILLLMVIQLMSMVLGQSMELCRPNRLMLSRMEILHRLQMTMENPTSQIILKTQVVTLIIHSQVQSHFLLVEEK